MGVWRWITLSISIWQSLHNRFGAPNIWITPNAITSPCKKWLSFSSCRRKSWVRAIIRFCSFVLNSSGNRWEFLNIEEKSGCLLGFWGKEDHTYQGVLVQKEGAGVRAASRNLQFRPSNQEVGEYEFFGQICSHLNVGPSERRHLQPGPLTVWWRVLSSFPGWTNVIDHFCLKFSTKKERAVVWWDRRPGGGRIRRSLRGCKLWCASPLIQELWSWTLFWALFQLQSPFSCWKSTESLSGETRKSHVSKSQCQ